MKKINIFILISGVLAFLTTGCDNTAGGGFENSKPSIGNTKSTVANYIYMYDNAGRMIEQKIGNDSYIKYTYDDSGNLISQEVVR